VTVGGVREAEPERLDSSVAWATEAWRRWPLGSLVGGTIPLAEVGTVLAAADVDDRLVGVEPG
ncbi:hypothetical protein, partial [Frigoribacterium faeni]|uniref:hypothetical protein n=1 Tax=Frigoribacterium faeni TaxID=145483 RepID=UPI00241386AD